MTQVTVLMSNGKIKKMSSMHARALIHVKKAVLFNEYETKVLVPEVKNKEKKGAYKIKSLDETKEKKELKKSDKPEKSKD